MKNTKIFLTSILTLILILLQSTIIFASDASNPIWIKNDADYVEKVINNKNSGPQYFKLQNSINVSDETRAPFSGDVTIDLNGKALNVAEAIGFLPVNNDIKITIIDTSNNEGVLKGITTKNWTPMILVDPANGHAIKLELSGINIDTTNYHLVKYVDIDSNVASRCGVSIYNCNAMLQATVFSTIGSGNMVIDIANSTFTSKVPTTNPGDARLFGVSGTEYWTYADVMDEEYQYATITLNNGDTYIAKDDLVLGSDTSWGEYKTKIEFKDFYGFRVYAPTFDKVTEEYNDIEGKSISIKAINGDRSIKDVTVDSEDFVIVDNPGATLVHDAETNTSFTIKPAQGLKFGEHKANVIVTDNEEQTYMAEVKFNVNKYAPVQYVSTAEELKYMTCYNVMSNHKEIETIKLINDIDYSGELIMYVHDGVTHDLNGYTLNVNNTIKVLLCNIDTGGGTYTFTDSSTDRKGKIVSTYDGAIILWYMSRGSSNPKPYVINFDIPYISALNSEISMFDVHGWIYDKAELYIKDGTFDLKNGAFMRFIDDPNLTEENFTIDIENIIINANNGAISFAQDDTEEKSYSNFVLDDMVPRKMNVVVSGEILNKSASVYDVTTGEDNGYIKIEPVTGIYIDSPIFDLLPYEYPAVEGKPITITAVGDITLVDVSLDNNDYFTISGDLTNATLEEGEVNDYDIYVIPNQGLEVGNYVSEIRVSDSNGNIYRGHISFAVVPGDPSPYVSWPTEIIARVGTKANEYDLTKWGASGDGTFVLWGSGTVFTNLHNGWSFTVEFRPNSPNFKSITRNVIIKVLPGQLKKPTISGDGIYEYTGSEIVALLNNPDGEKPSSSNDTSKVINISGDKATYVGEYTITYSLVNSEKYEWIDNPSGESTLNWKIVATTPLLESAYTDPNYIAVRGTNVDLGALVNCTDECRKYITYSFDNDTTPTDTTINENILDVGTNETCDTLKIIATLPEIDINDDGVNEYESNSCVIEIDVVSKTRITLEGLVWSSGEYTSEKFEPQGVLTATPDYDMTKIETKFTSIDGKGYSSGEAPSKVGKYRVTYSIPADDPTYIGMVDYTFEITKKQISKPFLTEFEYPHTGHVIYPSIENIDSEYVNVWHSMYSDSIGDRYTLFSLNDIENTEWENHGGTESFRIDWKVVSITLSFETLDASLDVGTSIDLNDYVVFENKNNLRFTLLTSTSKSRINGVMLEVDLDETIPQLKILVNYPGSFTEAPLSGEINVEVTGIPVPRVTKKSSRYTISFETMGAKEVIQVQRVKRNDLVKMPNDPTRDGYTFDGWYLDKAYSNKYDFDKKVTKSFTLYAKWIENNSNSIVLTIDKLYAEVFGEVVANDVAPIIVNDRTMLPARFIAESLGATVEWIAEERKVVITKDDTSIVIVIDSDIAFVNEEEVKLDAPAFILNDRTYLPIRFISENLGAKVTWISETRQVIITK